MRQLAKSVAIYRCDYPGCDRRFAASGHLARHRRVHTGERRFICPYEGCGGRFSRKDNMMQHYRTHYGIRVRRPKKTNEDGKMEEYDREMEQRRKQIVDAMAVEATARMKIVEQQREMLQHQQRYYYDARRDTPLSTPPPRRSTLSTAAHSHHSRSLSTSAIPSKSVSNITYTPHYHQQQPFSMLRFRDLITQDSYETRDGRVQKRERDLQQLIPLTSFERKELPIATTTTTTITTSNSNNVSSSSAHETTDYSMATDSRDNITTNMAGVTPEQTPQLPASTTLFAATRRDLVTRSVSRSPIMNYCRYSPYDHYSVVSPQSTPSMPQRHEFYSDYPSPATAVSSNMKPSYTVMLTGGPQALPSPSSSPTLLHRLPLSHTISTDVLPVQSKRHAITLLPPLERSPNLASKSSLTVDPFFQRPASSASSSASAPISPITRPSSVGPLPIGERITLPPLRHPLPTSSPIRLPSVTQSF